MISPLLMGKYYRAGAHYMRAVVLRARYQSVAPVRSVRAAGWNSTFGIQASEQFGANLLPWNGLDLARVELTDTTLDLFSPRSLDILIRLKALEQEAGKFCSLAFRNVPAYLPRRACKARGPSGPGQHAAARRPRRKVSR